MRVKRHTNDTLSPQHSPPCPHRGIQTPMTSTPPLSGHTRIVTLALSARLSKSAGRLLIHLLAELTTSRRTELTQENLAGATALAQSSISRGLADLESAGLIKREVISGRNFYRLKGR